MHKFTYILLEFFTEDSKLMQPKCNIKDKTYKSWLNWVNWSLISGWYYVLTKCSLCSRTHNMCLYYLCDIIPICSSSMRICSLCILFFIYYLRLNCIKLVWRWSSLFIHILYYIIGIFSQVIIRLRKHQRHIFKQALELIFHWLSRVNQSFQWSAFPWLLFQILRFCYP